MTYQRLSVSKRRLKLNLDDLALILNKTNGFCPADGWSRQEGQTNQTNVASKQKSCQGLRIKTACACYQRQLTSINAFCWTLCILNSSPFFWHIILHMLVSSSWPIEQSFTVVILNASYNSSHSKVKENSSSKYRF